jgi:FkbM family methyltransferase
MMRMAHTAVLPRKLYFLGMLMRRMPRGLGKVNSSWDRLYRRIGGASAEAEGIDATWPAGEHGPVRSRRFGYRVLLNLQSVVERKCYFSAECPRPELEYLFPTLLRPRDQYFDVGAKIGMTALMANLLIGRKGRGFAFEPEPDLFARLVRHFELNGVSNITPVPFALSNEDSEMDFAVPRTHSCALGSPGIDHEGSRPLPTARTTVGRTYLERFDPTKPTIIRLDAGGQEVKVLHGFDDVLDRREIAIVCAVDPALLARAGDSLTALYEVVARHGFRPFHFAVRRGPFWSNLAVAELKSFPDSPREERTELLFAKPDSKIFRDRVAPYLTSDTREELASRMRIRVILDRSRPPAPPSHPSMSTLRS